MLVNDAFRGLLHLFYPALCEGCKRPLVRTEVLLCIGCAAHLAKTNFHHQQFNEAALRFTGRLPFYQVSSFAWFTAEGLLQHLMHRLKYDGQKQIGLHLGRQFGHELQASSVWKDIDVLVPVPLHQRKYAERGYNQSKIIAEGMGEVMGKPLAVGALQRIRYTQSQTQMSREERIDNVSKAFALDPRVKLEGKHVLLIDDVLTTGATLEAAAHALLLMPGVKISIATLGIAQQ